MSDDSGEIVQEAMEAAAATNVKVLSDGPAFYSNLAMSNAVADQQAASALRLAIVTKAADSILNTSPTEGGTDVAALGQLLKGLQMTPPPTPSST